MTISVPEYFLAYLLIKYVAVDLGLFPSLANVSSDTSFLDRLYYAFLPMLTLVLVIVAHMMRMTRASVLAVMASPYIEMAILKGLTKTRIVLRHALPNALAPIISVIALNLAYLIVGVVVVETVFVYPGLGQLMVDEVSKHDVPVVQACGLIFAAAFILLNMVADILAILSNPRLRQPRRPVDAHPGTQAQLNRPDRPGDHRAQSDLGDLRAAHRALRPDHGARPTRGPTPARSTGSASTISGAIS